MFAKRTIILKLATAFRDYLHAFMVHSQKLSQVGTGEGIALHSATLHSRFPDKKYKLKVWERN